MFKKQKIAAFLVIAALGVLLLGQPLFAAKDDAPLVLIKLEGTIDSGTKSYVKYALAEAERLEAKAVVMELDTLGGYLDAALAIRRLIDDYNQPVFAWVNPNAISAGAYLALAADEIYMVPGGTMGAAEPKNLDFSTADEKQISYWEKEMMALADRRGRDVQPASAMVRKETVVPGLTKAGELLTLTAAEAYEAGYCEGVAEDSATLLQMAGFPTSALVKVERRATDTLVGLIVNPVVGTILLMLGIGGLITEVLTQGFGVAGLVSITAFALYFGGHIAADMAQYWVLILFILGVILLLIEAFIPGFGVFGVAGLISTFAAIVLAAASVRTGVTMLIVAFILAGFLSYFLFRYFSNKGTLRHIILSEEEKAELGYVASSDQTNLVGLEGVVLSTLRPSGTAEIDGRRIDVISEGAFISAGERVVVDRVEGVRVIVHKLD